MILSTLASLIYFVELVDGKCSFNGRRQTLCHPRPSQAIPGHMVAMSSRMSHEAYPFPAQGTLLWCRGGREAPGPEPILTLRQAARGGREVETDGRCCEMTLNETAKSAWKTALTFWKHARGSGVLHFHMSDRPARWLLWISLATSRAIGGFGAVDLWDAKLWLCNSWKAIPRRFAEGFVERWALTDGCHGRQTIVCHSVEKFSQIIPAVAHCGPKHNNMLCTGMLFRLVIDDFRWIHFMHLDAFKPLLSPARGWTILESLALPHPFNR